jgi:Mg-chelatase subunit ChlD
MYKRNFPFVVISCILISVLVLSGCSGVDTDNTDTIDRPPTINKLQLNGNSFELLIENQTHTVTLNPPDGGELGEFDISMIETPTGQLVLLNDPSGKYLPEFRYFTSESPESVQVLLRLGEYSPYSLHFEHSVNLKILNMQSAGESSLGEIRTLLDPIIANGISGLLIAAPERLNEEEQVSLYETYLPGMITIAPKDMNELESVDNVLVITFLEFPEESLASIIAGQTESVNLVNMVGLSLEDLANFQFLADNPNLDPDALVPFGEKSIKENYNEVQTRTIKRVINIVQVIDQPCGSPDRENQIFAMEPMPGTSVDLISDQVRLFRCQEVSTEQINIINIDFVGTTEACGPLPQPGSVEAGSGTPVSGDPELAGVDVALVIDTSGSMGGEAIASAQSSAIQFTNRLDPATDRISLVSFESSASILSDLTNDFDAIRGLISGLEASGGTAIDAGLDAGGQALQGSDRPAASQVVVLLSDGFSDPDAAIAAANAIKSRGINIISVGVGGGDQGLLSSIASKSSDFLFAETNRGLKQIFDETALRITDTRIAAKDLTLRFNLDTKHYSLIQNLLTDRPQIVSLGTVEWKIPVVYEGQTIQRPLVVRSLTSESVPYGQLEVVYNQCEDGTQITLPAQTITEAQTQSITHAREVVTTGTRITDQLEVFETLEYVVDIGASGLFSVEVDGAGSLIPPQIVSGNASDYLYPLYSTERDGKNVSLFYLQDPRLYWFYLQSNGLEDTGAFSLDILDGETADLIPIQVDDPPIQSLIPPDKNVIYDLKGIAEGDYITVVASGYHDGYYPSFGLVGLDGEFSRSLYGKTLETGGTEQYTEVYKVSGTGPYRLIGASFDPERDTQFELEVVKGDSLGQTIGEIVLDQEMLDTIPGDSVHSWTFQGEEGQIIELSLTKDELDIVDYSLIGPDGSYMGGNYLFEEETESSSGPIELNEAGIYTIAVYGDQPQDATIAFTLDSLDLPPSVVSELKVSSPASAQMVNNRQDQWYFSGKAGEPITITILTSNPGAGVYFSLHRPDGERILYSSSNQGRGQLGPITLPQDGDYTLFVNSNTSIQGTYEISLNPSSTDVALSAPPTTTTIATPTSSPATQLLSSNILLYEDSGTLTPWISELLDSMSLQFTDIEKGEIGELTNQLNSGTKWDLIIISAEDKNRGIQGEIWDLVESKVVDENAALIAEMWNLDQTANGRVSGLLSACGIEFQRDLRRIESLYNLAPDHPILNEPNEGISLINFVPYWGDQAGDLVRLTSEGDATLVAGTKSDRTTDYGVLTTCLGGRVIIQTFSNHDFREEVMKALWENYIRYVLSNHHNPSP